MRFARATMAVPILVLGLTWLSFRAFETGAERIDSALNALDRFATIQSSMHRDALAARAGLLRNYDPLVREVKASYSLLEPLRKAAVMGSGMRPAVDRLAAAIQHEESLVEAFKSDNALLQNSLAYFGLFANRLETVGGLESQTPAVGALILAMLRLTLDTSPANDHEVAQRLNELAAQAPPPGESNYLQGLLAHGRLLQRLLPETDTILERLRSGPSKQAKVVRTIVEAHRLAQRTTARQSRLALYAVSVLLLALLAHLGRRLRLRALALRRRARLEHVIACISTGFINVRPETVNASIDEGLRELAACIGADRAYYLFRGKRNGERTWHRGGDPFPPGWPDRAWSLLAQVAPTAEGLVHVADADRLPSGETRELLQAAGVRSWACIARTYGECAGAMLGFDALGRRIQNSSGELALLRVAFDAGANALRRVSLERDRARLEQDLQHARRMETVGALAAGVAHNFNNILGAILGYTEMAKAQVGTDSEALGDLDEIRQAGERGRDLVDQILTFGRRRDAPRRTVHLPRLVDETASLLHASLPPGIRLVVHEVQDAALVRGDQAQLQQVILNLCNNAAQAMNGVGPIELTADLLDLAAPRSLSQGDLAPGRYVRIAVSDVGHGMDPATMERVFEPFFTTRPAGNGLGLATVRDIVRDHGGAMSVASTPGNGSRFEAWLPLADDAAPDAHESGHEPPLGNGETILVIDDEHEQLLRHEEILAALGYEPVGFVRPAAAASACRAAPHRFDAFVVGHASPASCALELAAALGTIAPNVPILLARASADMATTDALLTAGVTQVVHRPFVSAEIAAALKRCLRPLASPDTALSR